MPDLKELLKTDGKAFPLFVISAALLFLTGRYLLFGVPHEFLTGEYKGTFEGDYDFTLELVHTFWQWGSVPLWSDTYSGPIAVFASNFHVFEQALLYPFTHDLAVSIKILQVLQFLVAGLGMYALSNYLYKDRTAAAFSAVLYMFTPFYIGHLLSYLHYTGVYLLAPLVFLLMLKAIDERSYYYAVLLCPVAAYSLLSHPQNAFIGGIFYALFFVLVFFYKAYESLTDGELRIFLKRVIPMTVVVVVITAALSAFIVLPTIIDNYPYVRTSWVKGAGELVKVDAGHIGSHSQSILASLSLQHWPWFQTPIKGSEYPAWPYMAVYMLPFIFAAMATAVRLDRMTAIFLIMTVFSVQTAMGVKGEPDLFTLASKYLPFFGMSRTPYAYINSAILIFCLLSSITFIWLKDKASGLFPARDARTKAGWILFLILALPYLLAARHYGNEYNWTFISAKQPDYLSSVWGWMDENNKDRHRVIETCGIPTAMILGQRMLPNLVDLLERHHKKDYLAGFLALIGFKYVITPSMHSQRDKTFDVKNYMIPSVFDKNESMEEYYSALTTEYYYMYERLKNDPAFKPHTAGTKDVTIFENTKAFADYEAYPARPLMVLGGTEAYDLLSLKKFGADIIKPAPVFIAQKENLKRLQEIKTVSDSLVLHNTDSFDLNLLINKDRFSWMKPSPTEPKDWELAINSFGIQQPFPQQDHSIGNSLFGEMTFSDLSVTSKTRAASVRGTFVASEAGTYRIMLRSYGGPEMSDLKVILDGKETGTIQQTAWRGFGWATLFEGRLENGAHSIELLLEEDKHVYVDTIVAGVSSSFDESTANSFKNITYIINHRRFALKGDVISTTVNTTAGVFVPSIRGGSYKEISPEGKLEINIDGRPAGEVFIKDLKGRVQEFILPDLLLPAGPHRVEISGLKEGVYFDLFALSALEENKLQRQAELKLVKTGPSSYRFKIPEGVRFIMFNETNYPGWRMSIEGRQERPLITHMFLNGFIVPEDAAGKETEIYYSNNNQRLGLGISGAALLLVSVVATGGLFMKRTGKGGKG